MIKNPDVLLALAASPDYVDLHGKPEHPRDLAGHNCLINTLAEALRRWGFQDGRRAFSVENETNKALSGSGHCQPCVQWALPSLRSPLARQHEPLDPPVGSS